MDRYKMNFIILPQLVRSPVPIPGKSTAQLGWIGNQDGHSSNFDQNTDYNGFSQFL
jgi:hypothetical protein